MVVDVSKLRIVAGLRKLGLRSGQVVLVHSAMRTLGHVARGADAVVDAFLEVLGEAGTLVVPTFTFVHETAADPIVDPQTDPSEMGIITETVRQRDGALRSIAYRHSFSAIGPCAKDIVSVDTAHSVFDIRSSFGVMLGLDTQVVLLGMTYQNSTSHHFGEWVCEVPYREVIGRDVRVREHDGRIQTRAMLDYQPKRGADGSYYGTRGPDFNRLGRMLETRGLVGMAAIGNAAVRRFPMRELIDLAKTEAAEDFNIFRTPEGEPEKTTPLKFGKVIISPVMLDGAGRENRYQWCVMDESKLTLPSDSQSGK